MTPANRGELHHRHRVSARGSDPWLLGLRIGAGDGLRPRVPLHVGSEEHNGARKSGSHFTLHDTPRFAQFNQPQLYLELHEAEPGSQPRTKPKAVSVCRTGLTRDVLRGSTTAAPTLYAHTSSCQRRGCHADRWKLFPRVGCCERLLARLMDVRASWASRPPRVFRPPRAATRRQRAGCSHRAPPAPRLPVSSLRSAYLGRPSCRRRGP